MNVNAYRKAIVAVVGAVVMLLPSLLLGDNRIDNVEWVQLAVAAFTALSVWLTANLPGAVYAKAITAGALAVLNLLVTYLVTDGHITPSLWVNLLIAGLTAAGVFAVRNDPPVTVV